MNKLNPIQATFADVTVAKLVKSCLRVFWRIAKLQGFARALRVFPIVFVIIKSVRGFSAYHRDEYQRLETDRMAVEDPEEAILTDSEHQKYRLLGRWLCKKLHGLGPIFIKIGQTLSTRADLLPLPAMLELAALQEDVQPFPTAIAREIIGRELGGTPEKLYAKFDDKPIAAASLAQAYKAKLHDGRDVVVKVQRPHLSEIIISDVQVLTAVADEVMRFPSLCRHTDWPGVVQEFQRTIFEEIDYLKEGRNADTFRHNFRSFSRICIPRIVWRLTGKRVLTIEYVAGARVDDLAHLIAQNIDPGEITSMGTNFYLKQLLEDGFFHADPHPGNMRIMDDGRIGIFDFGMVGRIDSDMKQHMIDALLHVVQRDYKLLIDDFVNMGFLHPSVNRHELLAELGPIIDSRFAEGMTKVRFRKILFDFSEICWRYPFRLPTAFTYIMRALLTLEGVALTINPDFNFISSVLPYAQRTLVKNNGAIGQALLRDVFPDGRFSPVAAFNLIKAATGLRSV